MDDIEGALPPKREPTFRQKFAANMIKAFANDLDTGTVAEQHTAALLRLAADAITNGYDAEAVVVLREWRLERERAG